MSMGWQSLLSVFILYCAHNYWGARIRSAGSWRAAMLVSHHRLGEFALSKHVWRKIFGTAFLWAGVVLIPLWFDLVGIALTMAAIVMYFVFGITATFDDYLKELRNKK